MSNKVAIEIYGKAYLELVALKEASNCASLDSTVRAALKYYANVVKARNDGWALELTKGYDRVPVG